MLKECKARFTSIEIILSKLNRIRESLRDGLVRAYWVPSGKSWVLTSAVTIYWAVSIAVVAEDMDAHGKIVESFTLRHLVNVDFLCFRVGQASDFGIGVLLCKKEG